MNGEILYEVIRIIDAKPLFLSDHYERLKLNVLSLSPNINLISKKELFSLVTKMIHSEQISNANIMIELIFMDKDFSDYTFSIKEIPHHYPSNMEYEMGVELGLFKYVRENPDLKIWKLELRERLNFEINERKVYELLYYNDDNNVSEGTRSNIFFLDGKKLFSPPLNKVLPGITRKHILKLAKDLGFNTIEREISIFELSSFQSAFMSGTSPKILPVRKIESFSFDVNQIYLRALMLGFDDLIKNELSEDVLSLISP